MRSRISESILEGMPQAFEEMSSALNVPGNRVNLKDIKLQFKLVYRSANQEASMIALQAVVSYQPESLADLVLIY